jgi:hypothetical protein
LFFGILGRRLAMRHTIVLLSVLAFVGSFLGCGSKALRGNAFDASGGAGTSAGGGTSGGAGTVDAGSNLADTGVSDGAAGGGGRAPCALRIVETLANDRDGDGFFVAPASADVGAIVEYTGDRTAQIIVSVTSDDPRVVPESSTTSEPENLLPNSWRVIGVGFAIPGQVWPGSEVGFTVRASVADDPTCTVTAPEPYVLTTGKSASELEVCDDTRQLKVTFGRIVGTGPQGQVQPGTTFQIETVLENTGPRAHSWYPYVSITPDKPGVNVEPNSIFALSAGESWSATMVGHVSADILPGTVVDLSISAAALQVRCCNVRTQHVPLPIQ